MTITDNAIHKRLRRVHCFIECKETVLVRSTKHLSVTPSRLNKITNVTFVFTRVVREENCRGDIRWRCWIRCNEQPSNRHEESIDSVSWMPLTPEEVQGNRTHKRLVLCYVSGEYRFARCFPLCFSRCFSWCLS